MDGVPPSLSLEGVVSQHRQLGRGTDRQIHKEERESVCVYVCVCLVTASNLAHDET